MVGLVDISKHYTIRAVQLLFNDVCMYIPASVIIQRAKI